MRTAPKKPGEGDYAFYGSSARSEFETYRNLLMGSESVRSPQLNAASSRKAALNQNSIPLSKSRQLDHLTLLQRPTISLGAGTAHQH